MFLTKKAIHQADVPERRAGCSGPASTRRDDSRRHGVGPDAREAGAEARLRVYPDGVRSGRDGLRPARETSTSFHPSSPRSSR